MGDERATNNVDLRIGQRVRTRRLEIGMSQERLADALGVTFQQVQKYEKGTNRIAASRLFDMSRVLDIPIARFFEGLSPGGLGGRPSGSKAAAAGDSIHDALATSEGVQLMTLYGSIKSRKVRQRVVELVRTLAEGGGRT